MDENLEAVMPPEVSYNSTDFAELETHVNSVIKTFSEMGQGAITVNELPAALTKPKDFVYDKLPQSSHVRQYAGSSKSEKLDKFQFFGLQNFLNAVDKTNQVLKKIAIDPKDIAGYIRPCQMGEEFNTVRLKEEFASKK